MIVCVCGQGELQNSLEEKMMGFLDKNEDTGISLAVCPPPFLLRLSDCPRSFLGPSCYSRATSSGTLWQGLRGAAHTMLSANPMASAGTQSTWPCLGTPFVRARMALKHKQATHTVPRRLKIGTTLVEHNLAVFLKTKDAPTLSPSFSFEKSVLRKHARACPEAGAQTCLPQPASHREGWHQPTCPSKCTKMQRCSLRRACNPREEKRETMENPLIRDVENTEVT